MSKKRKDKSGERHGRLVVLRMADDYIDKSGVARTMWECQCDCGNIIRVRGDSLCSNHTMSCGCLQKEMAAKAVAKTSKANTRYDKSEKRIRNIWYLMKYRCENQKSPAYKNYGGRGISVCDEWSNDIDGYESFKSWAHSNGYCEDLTIERIDNQAGYSPDNCCWITKAKQNSNKRSNRIIEFKGETHTTAEWGRITGFGLKAINRRLNLGWSAEKTLTQPIRN